MYMNSFIAFQKPHVLTLVFALLCFDITKYFVEKWVTQTVFISEYVCSSNHFIAKWASLTWAHSLPTVNIPSITNRQGDNSILDANGRPCVKNKHLAITIHTHHVLTTTTNLQPV